jgi:hypothetical protein
MEDIDNNHILPAKSMIGYQHSCESALISPTSQIGRLKSHLIEILPHLVTSMLPDKVESSLERLCSTLKYYDISHSKSVTNSISK